MAQYDEMLKAARSAGLDDNQIRSGLRGAGWGDKDIAQVFPDTFAQESGLSGLGALIQGGLKNLASGSPSQIVQGGVNTAADMLQGIGQNLSQELGKAWQAAKNIPKPGGEGLSDVLMHLVGAIPIEGPPLQHLAQNVTQGNVGGGLGDLVALFGPELAKGALKGASALGEKVAPPLYRRNLPFSSDSSIRDIEGAVKTGIKGELPAQNLFSGKGGSLDRIGRTDQPGTIMGDLEAQTKPLVTGQGGATPIRMDTALAPFLKEVNGKLDAPTATGHTIAAGMLKEAEPALRKLSPLMDAVFNDDPAKGAVHTTAQRASLIDAWARNNKSALTVGDAHIAKRGMYNTLADSAFKDTDGTVPSGSKAANLALSKGYKDAINEAQPGMVPINEKMHNVITLQGALNEAAKQSPKEFNLLTQLAVGGAFGSAVAMRGGGLAESGGAGMAGILALQALKSPRIATQLSILMGSKFPKLATALQPFATPVGLGQAILGHQPVQQPQ